MSIIEHRKRLVEIWEAVAPAHIESPEANQVAQGRQYSTSTCADLAHYGYAALGLHHPRFNRSPGWMPGVNVSRLAYWKGVASPAPVNLEGVDGGDVLIRWARRDTLDAHVVCVLARDIDATWLNTAEYGQARPWIGRQFLRDVVPQNGESTWRIWLPLPAVLKACGVAL